LVVIAASLVVVLLPSASAVSPGTQSASTLGPHTIWWASSVWNNRIPGDTVRYLFLVYNENNDTGDPSNATMTLKSLTLQTPWANFTATGLPVAVCDGCRYAWAQYLTIPTTQQTPANVTFYTRLTGNYGSGTPLCTDTGSVCEDVTPVTVVSNSSSIQGRLNAYSDVYLPLGIGIPGIIAVALLVLYARKPSI
jgi:hypothetical protein